MLGQAGQRRETGIGLYDYGARFYDPLIGRFISADSIVPGAGNPQSLNRYAYVLNNPIRYNDPTGHACEDPRRAGGCGGASNGNSGSDYGRGRIGATMIVGGIVNGTINVMNQRQQHPEYIDPDEFLGAVANGMTYAGIMKVAPQDSIANATAAGGVAGAVGGFVGRAVQAELGELREALQGNGFSTERLRNRLEALEALEPKAVMKDFAAGGAGAGVTRGVFGAPTVSRQPLQEINQLGRIDVTLNTILLAGETLGRFKSGLTIRTN